MKRLVLRIVLVGLLLLVAAIVAVLVMIDPIAKTGLENAAGSALGVETRVDELSLSLLRGRLTINGLRVSNPQGFTSSHLMRSGRFRLELEPLSVFTRTVRLRRFELDGLDVNIEQTALGNNVSKIMDNLKRFGKTDQKTQGPGKKVRVDRILIRNVVAHFHLLPQLAASGTVTVTVPEIELTDVTSDSVQGVLVGELVSRLVPAILASIIEQSKGVVPAEFLTGLKGQLTGLTETLGEDAARLVKQAGQLDKALGKGTKEAVRGLLEGILQKNKKPAEKDKNQHR